MRRARDLGFALMEVVVGLGLLSALAISAVPAIRALQDERLRAAAQRLALLVEDSRCLALTSHRAVSVVLTQSTARAVDGSGARLNDPWSGEWLELELSSSAFGATVASSSFGANGIRFDVQGTPVEAGTIELSVGGGGTRTVRLYRTGLVSIE
ncbi:MAG: hypothetical protein U1E76_16255 [Planctomycetota bacterium]